MQDFEYFRKRVAQEDERARRTMGSEAELIHRALATHYAKKAMSVLAGRDAVPNDRFALGSGADAVAA
jgi:hypothetical protein